MANETGSARHSSLSKFVLGARTELSHPMPFTLRLNYTPCNWRAAAGVPFAHASLKSNTLVRASLSRTVFVFQVLLDKLWLFYAKKRARLSRSSRASSLEKGLAPSTGRSFVIAITSVKKFSRCLEGNAKQQRSNMAFLWLVFRFL